MVSFVSANEVAKVTIPAGEKIAVFSDTAVVVTKEVGYPNRPTEITPDFTTTAGQETVSSAYTNETVIYLDAGSQPAQYQVGSSPSIADPITDFTFGNATGTITGLAAAQGGTTSLVGGASSTSANAGGASALLGGAPGATGVGGAATVTGAAGGATSGAGGVASVTGGAGTAGNSAGGVGKVVGGAGQGSAAGGKGQVTGGQGGATGVGGTADVTAGAGGATSGKGGAANVTGGAGTAGNASGGSVVIAGGAKHGSGLDGGVFNRGTTQFRAQAAAVAKADGAESVTAAQMINGICVFTVTTGRTMTTPTGAALVAGCPTDLAAGDSFDFTLITIGSGADDIATLTAGDGDVTFVGEVTVGPSGSTFNNYGTWRFRYAGTNAWVGYRIG